MNIDDLSYSGITDQLQGDEIKGADMLVEIAKEREQLNLEIQNLEDKLDSLTCRRGQLLVGSKMILKHLERKAPLAVKRKDFIVVVSENDVSIERNVL